ncbi:MAG: hypothetical protein ACRD0K_19970 [Egibacteraceae bacterium]
MRDCPGNGHALACLREIVASRQGIAFVGAGASAGLYPLWGELIRQLADEAVKRGDGTDDDRAYWLRNAASSPQQVVRGIKERLGGRSFFALLEGIFAYRTGPDGNPFTPVHRALLTLPFRGYVTTNYDSGLLEARRACRPRARATGYCTWKDRDPLRAWLTGEVFGEQSCPILYAHGIFERSSETIVLGASEYHRAYQPGLFHELIKKLWGQERLVFVRAGRPRRGTRGGPRPGIRRTTEDPAAHRVRIRPGTPGAPPTRPRRPRAGPYAARRQQPRPGAARRRPADRQPQPPPHTAPRRTALGMNPWVVPPLRVVRSRQRSRCARRAVGRVGLRVRR